MEQPDSICLSCNVTRPPNAKNGVWVLDFGGYLLHMVHDEECLLCKNVGQTVTNNLHLGRVLFVGGVDFPKGVQYNKVWFTFADRSTKPVLRPGFGQIGPVWFEFRIGEEEGWGKLEA